MRPLYRALRVPFELPLSLLAFIWRRVMSRTKVIAVTGSVGKTTATRCLGTILSSQYPTNWSPNPGNARRTLAMNILRTRGRHKFTVIEVGTRRPGALWRASRMIDPDVAIVLMVKQQHSNNFPDLAAIAAEKEQLLRRLGPEGTAVINGDDPYVRAMAAKCRSRIVTFGLKPQSDIRASEVSARWPERLSFRVHMGNESIPVKTNLLGEHWVYSVLGALAAAVACGIDLKSAAMAMEMVQPVPGRMDPLELPNGATFVRDEWNSSMASLEAGLEMLGKARAARRILLLQDVLDSGLGTRPRFRELGRRAAAAADIVVFVGPFGSVGAKAAVAAGLNPASSKSFHGLQAASEFLRSELRRGDLVLLHGWPHLHLERICLALSGKVDCWKEWCWKNQPCDQCRHLTHS